MNVDYATILYLIVPAVLLGWIFRRIGLFEVVGYILGGALSYYVLEFFSLPADNTVAFTRPLQVVGLALFSFEIGASLDVRGVSKSIQTVVSAELILVAIGWITTGIVARVLGLTNIERFVLILMLVNSSTYAIIVMQKVGITRDSYERAVIQTSLEDLLQFSLFSILILSPFITSPNPLNIVVYIIQVAGSIILIFLAARLAMIVISKSPLSRTKLDKFFLLIAMALSFSAFATILNLPDLLGSFIAGLATSLFINLEDIRDMLNGVRDLGLLLYFSSIGASMAPWLVQLNPGLLATVLIVTLTIVITRIIGLVTGFAVSGLDFRESISLSLILSPISETGIVFAYILYSAGLVDAQLVVLVTTVVILSQIISSPVMYRSSSIAIKIELKIPRKLVLAINTVSRIYREKVSFAIETLSVLAWFSAISLTVSFLTNITADLLLSIGTPTYFLVVLMITSLIVLFTTYVLFLRKLTYSVFKALIREKRIKPLIVLDIIMDSIMGFIAIALQIYLLYEYVSKYYFLLDLREQALLLYIATLIAVLITVYATIHYYRVLFRERAHI